MVSRVQCWLPAEKPPFLALKSFAENNSYLFNLIGQICNIASSVSLLGYGIKEILLDSHPNWFHITPHPNHPPAVQKVVKAVDWLLCMIRNQPAHLADKVRFSMHGLLMIGSGATGIVSAADRLGWVSLGPTLPIFDIVSAGLFIAGNIIYLEINIEKFIESARKIKGGGNQKQFIIQGIAAAIGIGSNLAYISASTASLAGAPLIYPVALGIVGLLAGSLRIFLESYISFKKRKA